MVGRIYAILGRATLVVALFFCMILASPPVSAINFFGDACTGAGRDSAACPVAGDKITGSDGVIIRAAELMSIIAGIAAVLIIMVAGFLFITANGDSNKISTARHAVTYAVVGLIVIFLARTIVVFVVNNV